MPAPPGSPSPSAPSPSRRRRRGFSSNCGFAPATGSPRGPCWAGSTRRGLEEQKAIAEARAAATAARDAAVIEADLVRRRLAKFEAVGADQLGSRDELERARADAALADVRVRKAEEDAALATLDVARIAAALGRRTVRSPAAGTVVAVQREAGEAVSAADPVVAVLAKLDVLRAVFHPPAAVAARLRKGEAVAVRFAGIGVVRGTVDFVSPRHRRRKRHGAGRGAAAERRGPAAVRHGLHADG